jgi:hypothetical protein
MTAALLLGSFSALADSSDFKFELHGIASTSFYVQDTPTFVLNGQGPLIALSEPSLGATTGFDIRQTRLNFSVSGPKLFGDATPKAVAEIDFFNLNGPGGYGEVSAVPRLRLAYLELKWDNTVVRIGQDWQLLWTNAPASIGHLAYPAVYFNGLIGWREPGVTVYQTWGSDENKVEAAISLEKADWENPADFGTSSVQDLNVDYGQLGGFPAVEARVKWSMDKNMLYVAGHWNHVAGTHATALVAPPASAPGADWDVMAAKFGWKGVFGDLTFQGELYTGKNLGPVIGNELQFPVTNDVKESGGWVQLGYNVTNEWSVWAIAGTSRPNLGDAAMSGQSRLQDNVAGGMIKYQTGGFAVGPEVYHVVDLNKAAAGSGAPDGVIDANQYMLSANYYF